MLRNTFNQGLFFFGLFTCGRCGSSQIWTRAKPGSSRRSQIEALDAFASVHGTDFYQSCSTEGMGAWQAHYSDAAADSALHRPGFSAVMAQPLYDLFARRLAAPAAAAAPRRADPASGPGADPAEELGGAAPMEYEAPAGYEDMGAPAYDPQPDGAQDAGALDTRCATCSVLPGPWTHRDETV